jgi:transcriptional regulator with XRE-family HTH domain
VGSQDDWERSADEREATLPKLGTFPIAGLVRRVRRIADLSQRELAKTLGISSSTVGRVENGTLVPTLRLFQRMLAVAQLRLVAIDQEGHIVEPMRDIEDIRDGAGRLYPSHLDTILDPVGDEWWGTKYGLAKPPETFHRDRELRDYQRALSVYHVRTCVGYEGEPPVPPRRTEYGPWPVGFRRRRKKPRQRRWHQGGAQR